MARMAPALGHRGGDATGALAETAELTALLHAAAELADALAENGLGLVLRDIEHVAER